MVTNHLVHCIFMTTFLASTVYMLVILKRFRNPDDFDHWQAYGTFWCVFLYFSHICVLLAIPQTMLSILGLFYFNPFPDKVTLRPTPRSRMPLICVRVVTRGDYPRLVRDNVIKNMEICAEAGIRDFCIEVITEKDCELPQHPQIRQLLLPPSYTPKSGALFKARALQYCLEDDVNTLNDNDYIVHLDEETLLTANSARGIINFVSEGKYDFGQGLITYADGPVVNWITTLADGSRVTDDMGKLRAQFKFFHKPLFSWKGSFMVGKVGAERKVSFDNGIEGSIAEDCFFAMKAYQENYTFDFIEGEMNEQSTFTVGDFIKQRKRWLRGIILVFCSSKILWRYKLWLTFSLSAWITMPFTNILIGFLFPLQIPSWLFYLSSFVFAYILYTYLYGVLKSLYLRKFSFLYYVLCVLFIFIVYFVSTFIESIAVLAGLFDNKLQFYIVQKDTSMIAKAKGN